MWDSLHEEVEGGATGDSLLELEGVDLGVFETDFQANVFAFER